MNLGPMMTAGEIDLLARYVKPEHLIWEWGSGGSTLWLAERCRYITSVEYKPQYSTVLTAMAAVGWAPRNLSVLYVPPDDPFFQDGTEDDGDLNSFRSFVECYTGKGIDVCLIDGRARVECARFAAERAPFGPTPSMLFLLHDADRPQYETIWKDQPERKCIDEDGEYTMPATRAAFEVIERVDNLLVMRWRPE